MDNNKIAEELIKVAKDITAKVDTGYLDAVIYELRKEQITSNIHSIYTKTDDASVFDDRLSDNDLKKLKNIAQELKKSYREVIKNFNGIRKILHDNKLI